MQVSSTSSQDPGSRPTVSRPMSSVSGCRPVANSASSASTSPPSSRVRVTGPVPPGRRIPVTVTPIRTSIPASAERAGDQFPGERLHPGQQAVGLGQQGDRGAQAGPGAGHLHPDPAAADDGQPSRHGVGAGGLPVGPGPRLGQAGQFGQGRPAAGADHHRVPGGQGHRPALGRRPRRPAGGRPAARARGSARRRGFSARRPALGRSSRSPTSRRANTAGASTVPVTAWRAPADPAGVGDRDDRPEHRLAGDAGPVGALPPDQFLFHGRHAESRRARPGGHGVPDRPGADDDHVVHVLRRSAHGLRIDRARPQHIVKTDN